MHGSRLLPATRTRAFSHALDVLEPRTLLTGGWLSHPVAPGEATTVVTADLDGDGDQDAVTQSFGTSTMNVLLNTGDGALTLHQQVTLSDPQRGNLSLVDFDADGDIDIVAGGPLLFRNNGAATFAAPDNLGIPAAAFEGAVVFADADGDGLPDAYLESLYYGFVAFYRNVSGDTLVWEHQVSGFERVLAVVDIDDDGDFDIVDENLSVTLSNGDGTYTPGPAGQGGSFIDRPLAGDVNNDGLVDAVWVDFHSRRLVTAINLDNGVFAAPQFSGSSDWRAPGALADFNGYGLLDFLGTSAAEPRVVIAYAIAPGVFSETVQRVTPGTVISPRLFAAEMNGDGRAEVLMIRPNMFTGTLAVFRSVPAPVVTAATAPSEPVIPGRFLTFTVQAASGVVAAVTAVRVYRDANDDGVFTPGTDPFVGAGVAADPSTWTVSVLIDDSVGAGAHRFFAVAEDEALGTSDAASASVTIWARVSYPEGWRNDATINEYVPIVNPNPFPVEYRLVAHYETGERDQVIAQGVLAPFSRGGVTTTERSNPAGALVRLNEAYALELQSSGFLGAMLSHYDSFGNGVGASGAATGEAFTSDFHQAWHFARASTGDAAFLVYFNPFEQAVTLTITFIDASRSSTTIQRTLAPLRRGGIALNDPSLALLPDTAHSIIVAADAPILAALSTYSFLGADGSTALGTPALASGWVDFTLPDYRDDVAPILTLANLDEDQVDTASVEFRFADGSLITRTYLLDPLERRTIDLRDFLPAPADVLVARVSAASIRAFLEIYDLARGDSLGASPATESATAWAFADGFLDRATAGNLGIEELTLFNPGGQEVSVRVRFIFTDGTYGERTVQLGAGRVTSLALHEEHLILDHAPLNFYSIMVDAGAPIVASMTHWDLFQNGGWSTLGTPTGTRGLS